MVSSTVERSLQLLAQFRARLGLSVAASWALLMGVVVLAVTTVVLGGVAEDVTQHNGLARTDLAHLRWFITQRSDALVSLARLLTDIGNVALLGGLAVVAAMLLWRRGIPVLVAAAPALALGVAGLLAALGKTVVARSRPPVALHLVSEGDASFPSGHATDATAVLVTLALVVAIYVLRRPFARCACVLGAGIVAAAIGASRLVLGVHWPTDVLAGWALGASAALFVTIAVSLAVRIVPKRGGTATRGLPAWCIRLATAQRRPGTLRSA